MAVERMSARPRAKNIFIAVKLLLLVLHWPTTLVLQGRIMPKGEGAWDKRVIHKEQ